MDKCNEETPDLPAAQSQGPDAPLDTTGPGLATWTDKDITGLKFGWSGLQSFNVR
jgi:hypothetical protein